VLVAVQAAVAVVVATPLDKQSVEVAEAVLAGLVVIYFRRVYCQMFFLSTLD
jgi:hypothetical protein